MSVDNKSSEEFWEEVEEHLGIAQRDGKIILNNDESGATNLAEFVEFLVENGYINDADLPIESGWKRYLVSKTPHHKEGEEMFRPRETSSGLFVETNHNLDAIKQKIHQLACKVLSD